MSVTGQPGAGAPIRKASIDLASTGAARGTDPLHSVPSDQAAQIAAARIAGLYKDQPGALLPILHAIQHELGCIPPETVQVVADALNRSRAEVHGVITFYPHFRSKPAGRHVVEICRAEACQSRGGEQLADHARKQLGCDFHETSADGAVTLEPVYCLGLCSQSPSVMIDGQPHARVTTEKFNRLMQGVQS
ncbi:NAD-dependent formate dehydrogenase gamma subunit [plant metagenome]|uniref:NAD-dependent formate dehydrogenase gamma subunit n=1 Tax=plant metagenome TaxID=1297885 RepID=A0A484P1H3_9ZZZZ